uniref:Uncharacterized protein n=1 Tax=Candidatus Methanophaga sp. ANME-1 ERB7 TaxID=2759913 RepID=A0A7G9Z794_9EURY|nr:hypothetical protein PNCMNLLH_00006 [Methanosarcinales archaeon ANME-1 ERB7]QNO56163.1 hypothetical protein LLPGBHFJ_00006 [Methanosarcinales archaeon ANME-1 ERB7]
MNTTWLFVLLNPCKPVARELVREFGKSLSFIGPKLKDQRVSIREYLSECIIQYFESTEVWRYWGEDVIQLGRSQLEIQSIPVAELNCASISDCLAAHIANNLDLDAARNAKEINNGEWKAIADIAASEVLKRALQTAIRTIINREQIFGVKGSSDQYVLLDIAEKEAYVINGASEYVDMLKIYDSGGVGTAPPKKARKMWLKRHDKRNFYKRGQYTNPSFRIY